MYMYVCHPERNKL